MTYRQKNANPQLFDLDSITSRITTRKMKKDQELSRLTLGEIGNRVSTIKLDATKDQPLKKDVNQFKSGLFILGQATKVNAKPTSNVGAVNKNVVNLKVPTKIATAKVNLAVVEEKCPANKLQQPCAPRIAEGDIVLTAAPAQNVAPMDISGVGLDAFSKDLFAAQVTDIDNEDKADPQQVCVYANSIFSYMRHLERKLHVKENFLQATEITAKMRAILLDWLCRVHHKFHLLQETFYLTVSIIDRYLQIKTCRRSRLQLVGVSAMLVASKYEEMYAPDVADFVYITDNAYTNQDVRDMEQDILRTLDFNLGGPHCLHFHRRNIKAAQADSSVQADASVHALTKYLMELSVLEYEMAHLSPSIVAAAALRLSMLVHDETSWSPTLQFYSSYSVGEIMPIVESLAQLVVKAETSKLTAVRSKYSSSEFMKIALVPQLRSKTILDLASAKTTKK